LISVQSFSAFDTEEPFSLRRGLRPFSVFSSWASLLDCWFWDGKWFRNDEGDPWVALASVAVWLAS
jgi:hypothetical protein